MKNIPLEQLKEEIPTGSYCYGEKGNCPYWSIDENHEIRDNGYCEYLEVGDWMDTEENCYTNEKTGEKMHLGLLWDQVKLCDINKIKRRR